MILCGICLDVKPAPELVCARGGTKPDQALTRARAVGCGHHFCGECMQQYTRNLVREHKFPLRCATSTCSELIARADVRALLETSSPADFQVYLSLEKEHRFQAEQRVYCPYKDCSFPSARPRSTPASATACPKCRRAFCASCLIPGWHDGMTCEQFQALPAHQRSAEDAAMLGLLQEQNWRQCPQCSHVVERIHGCNHVTCRCGCGFCYACGCKYVDGQGTANNTHGTPSCKCALFPGHNMAMWPWMQQLHAAIAPLQQQVAAMVAHQPQLPPPPPPPQQQQQQQRRQRQLRRPRRVPPPPLRRQPPRRAAVAAAEALRLLGQQAPVHAVQPAVQPGRQPVGQFVGRRELERQLQERKQQQEQQRLEYQRQDRQYRMGRRQLLQA